MRLARVVWRALKLMLWGYLILAMILSVVFALLESKAHASVGPKVCSTMRELDKTIKPKSWTEIYIYESDELIGDCARNGRLVPMKDGQGIVEAWVHLKKVPKGTWCRTRFVRTATNDNTGESDYRAHKGHSRRSLVHSFYLHTDNPLSVEVRCSKKVKLTTLQFKIYQP